MPERTDAVLGRGQRFIRQAARLQGAQAFDQVGALGFTTGAAFHCDEQQRRAEPVVAESQRAARSLRIAICGEQGRRGLQAPERGQRRIGRVVGQRPRTQRVELLRGQALLL